MRLRRTTLIVAVAACIMAIGSFAMAGVGPPGGVIYAGNMMFKTVGTPALLPPTGKFDTIYVLGGSLAAVADAVPGTRDFNGGRWEVRPIQWLTIQPMQFTNADDIKAAAARGEISIGSVVKRFECPLIPMH